MTAHRAFVSRIVLALVLLSASWVAAQSTGATSPPVPARILSGKTVFLANGGWDEHSTDTPAFTGGPDRAYDQLYSALQAWGRYKLVGDPSEADLLFEIRFQIEPALIRGGTLTSAELNPELSLTIRDPKTNALLWVLDERVSWALLQGNRDKNFDQGIAKTVGDLQRIALQQGSTPGPAKTE